MVVEGAVTLSLPSEAPFSGHAAIGTPPSESVKACGPFMYLHMKPDEAQTSSMSLMCLQKLAHAAEGFCIVLQYITYTALSQCVWVDRSHFIHMLQAHVRQMYVGLVICMLNVLVGGSAKFDINMDKDLRKYIPLIGRFA